MAQRFQGHLKASGQWSPCAGVFTWFAGDGLQRQGHLWFRGYREGLRAGVEGRDHHVGHVHLLRQHRREPSETGRVARPWQACPPGLVTGADLDLLLKHVDFVLLLDQLLLLFGNLRHKRHVVTCLCLPSLSLI